jgi:acetylornithine deacetylase/succinyl-diaminopimelate desuccinylase-like protein
LSLRGICGVQIDVKGATSDLHSGMAGGTIQNPIHALVHLLDTMHASDGTITIDGFYETVKTYSEEERAEIARVPHEDEEYLESMGLHQTFGEPGYTTLERKWIRPTLEINGIWGGFQGAGTKTVLPNEAHAKITCRLVADQDPAHIRDLVMAHVEKHAPPGVTVTVNPLPIFGKPYAMAADHPGNEAARIVHEELYGTKPYYVRSGGSIPVCGLFLDHLGAYTVNFGFGLPDESVHAPNEFYRLSSFEKGQKAYSMLLNQLGA